MLPYVPYKRIRIHKRHGVTRFALALALAALFILLSIGVGTWALLLR